MEEEGMREVVKVGKRGNLKLALKLLGRGLVAAGYREKGDILKFSEEVRKKVHEERSQRGKGLH